MARTAHKAFFRGTEMVVKLPEIDAFVEGYRALCKAHGMCFADKYDQDGDYASHAIIVAKLRGKHAARDVFKLALANVNQSDTDRVEALHKEAQETWQRERAGQRQKFQTKVAKEAPSNADDVIREMLGSIKNMADANPCTEYDRAATIAETYLSKQQ